MGFDIVNGMFDILPDEIEYNGEKYIPIMRSKSLTVTSSTQKEGESKDMATLVCVKQNSAFPSVLVLIPWKGWGGK